VLNYQTHSVTSLKIRININTAEAQISHADASLALVENYRPLPKDNETDYSVILMALINPLKTKRICFIEGLSAYRAVNTLHFGYKNQSLNVL
jgi:hypothetical protein